MAIMKGMMNNPARNVTARTLLFAILCILMVITYSCKDTVSSPDTSGIVFPASNVSYGKNVEPLFLQACAFSGCHDTESRADQLSLDNYQDAISSKPGVIIAKDTTQSRLVWRIEGKYGLAPMPFQRPALTTNQITGLKKWILEGAQNN
ncbi:MAG: hypothetical protein ACHQQQ_05705 [Bacteroidota bacterium]